LLELISEDSYDVREATPYLPMYFSSKRVTTPTTFVN